MKTGIDSVAMTIDEWRSLAATATLSPADVVGSYGNGHYANTTAARAALPHALHVQYDVNGSLPEMDLLDIEPQDAIPADAADWSHRHNAAVHGRAMVLRGPGLYCSASTSSEVISNMLDHGWRRSEFVLQSAHYTSRPHICGPGQCQYPQADSTQHIDHGPHGENVDLTLYLEHCFAGRLPVPPDPDARYDLFDQHPRWIGGTEAGTVREYDRWRATQTHQKHPHRLRLALLRRRLSRYRGRLARVIARQGEATANQRWRLRELADRAAGRRLV